MKIIEASDSKHVASNLKVFCDAGLIHLDSGDITTLAKAKLTTTGQVSK